LAVGRGKWEIDANLGDERIASPLLKIDAL
jgi:hypothetical protein